MSNIVPLEKDIRDKFLMGHSIAELSKLFGLPRFILSKILDHPTCHERQLEKLQTVRFRAVEYRLRAFEEAEVSLECLVNIRDTATDENLKRLASKDIIKFAGLEPRKIVEVQNHNSYGLDKETKDFYEHVMREVGGEERKQQDIVDAEIVPQE